ncbi:hypothetical protein EJB05_08348, partial [Eragrostis curvula]
MAATTAYERRLLAAADLVLSSDDRDQGAPSPSYLGVTADLKPHQLHGVDWLIRRYGLGVNVVLALIFYVCWQMGLGKTLQAISLLSYLKIRCIAPGPFLVLCPLSVTDGWLSEFSKFCPSLRVMQYVGDKMHRRDLRRIMYEDVQKPSATSDSDELSFDVLMTTYDIALMDQDFLSQIPWHYAVIDEAQRLKNPSSVRTLLVYVILLKISREKHIALSLALIDNIHGARGSVTTCTDLVRAITCLAINLFCSSAVLYNVLEQRFIMPRRLLLTGTPIQNNLSELWALMHFCLPSIFGKLDEFLSTFKEAGGSLAGAEANRANREFKILKHILRAFMLRRTKALLIEGGILALPPLTELTVSDSLLKENIFPLVIQLRKACSHPYLFSGIEPEPYVEGEHLVQASGKLIVLDLVLKKLHELGHRVLLFAQMTQTLDILQDFLELRNYTYERLDGSVRAEERFAAIRKFSSQSTKGLTRDDSQSGAFVFMISTRAGGVGLNLIGADTVSLIEFIALLIVIFYEQDWNPQADKQALQRTHRIGQLNHVLSINLVSERTIEEVIMRRAERKLKLSHNIIGEDDATAGKGEDLGNEASDMRSIIFGLHLFDPTDTAAETINDDSSAETISLETLDKLKTMSEKIVMMRSHVTSDKDERTFEVNPNLIDSDGTVMRRASDSLNVDPGLNEAAYLSWVKQFKEASHSIEDATVQLGRQRAAPEERFLKREANKKKAEEKRIAKWEALGYQTLAVKDPDIIAGQNFPDSGSVQLVYGDCTDPSKVCPGKPAIILSCMDDSGTWGHGGMFNALTSLSTCIPDAYHRASEFDDLHVGDLHLIQLDEASCSRSLDAALWVALAIVQSYNPRRKVPRSEISMPDLELCLSKAAFTAAQHSASIHMPRIGYQGGSQRSEWYTIERLLRKYSSLHGINIFVYYFQRSSRQQSDSN